MKLLAALACALLAVPPANAWLVRDDEPDRQVPAPAQGPAPAGERPLVAVAGFENRSTYSADKLWDTSSQLLTSELVRDGRFRVVEWERMKLLFDYETLSTTDLVRKPEGRGRARQILLCEYFITGAITRFDVVTRGRVSSFSKKKEFETTIRVDLTLMDAATGEYLSQGTGQQTEIDSYRGGITGGQTGTWDPASANRALERAIATALAQLAQRLFDQKRH
jgi:curli biogenesis system outer membrane secretion channel CsgG